MEVSCYPSSKAAEGPAVPITAATPASSAVLNSGIFSNVAVEQETELQVVI